MCEDMAYDNVMYAEIRTTPKVRHHDRLLHCLHGQAPPPAASPNLSGPHHPTPLMQNPSLSYSHDLAHSQRRVAVA